MIALQCQESVLKRLSKILFALFVGASTLDVAKAEVLQTQAGNLQVAEMASGLDQPWGFGFLPNGTVLITERAGRLLSLHNGILTGVSGTPNVYAEGQGGLLDILIPNDFAQTRQVFFTYAKKQPTGAGTAVYRARLNRAGTRLERGRTIFETVPSTNTSRHFGSRIVEASDGTLFVTIGDRGDRSAAQDLSKHNGKVLRIDKNGAPIPNPAFADIPGALPEIWSFGHRNPQGAALDENGQLWMIEHGAQGGDEVNRVEKGENYGWPIISYGRHYSGATIGEGTQKEGMQQPNYYWDPSIAPSGMTFYDGAIADWQGDLFVGSLKFDYISRLSKQPLREIEVIKSPITGRIRDIRQGPNGGLWFLSIIEGSLYKISP